MIRVLSGDCREVLRSLESGSAHCVVTSPPYFGLRDYGTGTWEGGSSDCDHIEVHPQAREGRQTPGGRGGSFPQSHRSFKAVCAKCGGERVDRQIGLEQSPDEYVTEMVAVFREVRRVLRNDGTLWLNMGDTYAANRSTQVPDSKSTFVGNDRPSRVPYGLKPKDLIGIPWMLAFALRSDGWWLRKDIIWAKPNPMPESATDRPTSSHEHIFLLTKRARYFYDAEAVREPIMTSSIQRLTQPKVLTQPGGPKDTGEGHRSHRRALTNQAKKLAQQQEDGVQPDGRNMRDVWTITTAPYPEAHFATFPPGIPERCIKAGTSERGCCSACGAPWERIIIKGEPDLEHQRASGGDAGGTYRGQSIKDHDAHGVQNASDVKRRILEGMREKSYDWQPTCKCEGADVVPCAILDPFGGAGTSGLVADRLSRDAILIELNESYVAMTERRLRADGGMFINLTFA